MAACKDRLIGSYGDQRDYEAGFHSGVDIGVPDNNQALEYAVYPATIEATVVDIHEDSYNTYVLIQTRAGDLYAYGHITPDPSLIEYQTVYPVGYPGHPNGTILGRIQITDGFFKPNSHLHFAQWVSKEEHVPIRNPLIF